MSIARNAYWRSRKGLRFEELALQYLQSQGLQLLQRNFRCKLGEIDLVMRHGETIAFVEVRFRQSRSHGGALATITRSKQLKLLRTARYFLLCHPELQQWVCRLDVIGIEPDAHGRPAFCWIRNAFC